MNNVVQEIDRPTKMNDEYIPFYISSICVMNNFLQYMNVTLLDMAGLSLSLYPINMVLKLEVLNLNPHSINLIKIKYFMCSYRLKVRL